MGKHKKESVSKSVADQYFIEGCGRCPLGNTPDCKVNQWTQELKQLRTLLQNSPLTEERKWGVPCYTFQKSNVVLLSAFKENCTLNFFKGALLKDPQKLLEKPGENTQVARVIRFTHLKEILDKENILKSYIEEAIEIEKLGLKGDYSKNTLPLPEELEATFENDPTLKMAFEALTPGRQKSYLLHFSSAKQSKTRYSRIEKCVPKIFQGKGFNER